MQIVSNGALGFQVNVSRNETEKTFLLTCVPSEYFDVPTHLLISLSIGNSEYCLNISNVNEYFLIIILDNTIL